MIFTTLQPYFQGLAMVSLATFVLSIACIPWLVGLLPTDYFLFAAGKTKTSKQSFTLGRILLLLLRNCLGLCLLLAGVAMLFLPGQGLITIIIGLAVMSFPYKKKLIQALCHSPAIRRSLDWLRGKARKERFIWP